MSPKATPLDRIETEGTGNASDSGESVVEVPNMPPPQSKATRSTELNQEEDSSAASATPATTRSSARRASRRNTSSNTLASSFSPSNSTHNDKQDPPATSTRSRSSSNAKTRNKMGLQQILSPSPHASAAKEASSSSNQVQSEDVEMVDAGGDEAEQQEERVNDISEVEKGLGGQDDEEEDQVESEPKDPQSAGQEEEAQPMEGVEQEEEEEEPTNDQEEGSDGGDGDEKEGSADENEGDQQGGEVSVVQSAAGGEEGDDEGESEEEDSEEEEEEEDSEEDEDDDDGERSRSLGEADQPPKPVMNGSQGESQVATPPPRPTHPANGAQASQSYPLQNGGPMPMEGVVMTDPASQSNAAAPLLLDKGKNLEGGVTDGGSASEATGTEAVDENGNPIKKKKKKGTRVHKDPTPPPEPPRPRPTVRLSLKPHHPSIHRPAANHQDPSEEFPYLLSVPIEVFDQLKSEGNDWADWWDNQQKIQADSDAGIIPGLEVEINGTGVSGVNGINGGNGSAEAGPSNAAAPGGGPDTSLLSAEERAFLARHQEGNNPQGPPPKKRRKRRNDPDGQYDVNDPFVDDSELALDEPTHAGQTLTRGFYVCSGDVEVELVKRSRKKRADAGLPRGGLAGGDPLEGEDSPTSTPIRQPKKVLTAEEQAHLDAERRKHLEEEAEAKKTIDLGVRSRMDSFKAANSLIVDHVKKFGFTSTMASSMMGSASHYPRNGDGSPTLRTASRSRSPSKMDQRTPSRQAPKPRSSEEIKMSPINIDDDGDEQMAPPPSTNGPKPQPEAGSSNLGSLLNPSPSPSIPQTQARTGPIPVPVPPGYITPTWVPAVLKHPVAPIPMRLVAGFDELKEKRDKESFTAKGKFPPDLKEPLKQTAKLALELGVYDDEHLFNYFPLIFPYNKLTTKKLTKREFFDMHLQYYHEVKDAITDNLKVSVNKAMAHQKAEHAKAVAEYEKGQVGRDALKAFKLKEKEQREERRKAEIQDQVAKKIEFPAGYWDKYPTGKWKDEDCLDEKEMAPILKKEKADSKDTPPTLRWSWNEEQRYMLVACLALADAEVDLKNEKANWENSNVKASQITVRKQVYQRLAECWPAGWGMNSTAVSKEFSAIKRRVDKALPQEFKDSEKERERLEKEAASTAAAAKPAV